MLGYIYIKKKKNQHQWEQQIQEKELEVEFAQSLKRSQVSSEAGAATLQPRRSLTRRLWAAASPQPRHALGSAAGHPRLQQPWGENKLRKSSTGLMLAVNSRLASHSICHIFPPGPSEDVEVDPLCPEQLWGSVLPWVHRHLDWVLQQEWSLPAFVPKRHTQMASFEGTSWS